MIAKKITVARQEKKEIIHKLELPKLSTVTLIKVASNFMLYPELKGLDDKSKLKVIFLKLFLYMFVYVCICFSLSSNRFTIKQ